MIQLFCKILVNPKDSKNLESTGNMVHWDKLWFVGSKNCYIPKAIWFRTDAIKYPPPPLPPHKHTHYNHHHQKRISPDSISKMNRGPELLTRIQWTENWKPCSITALTIHVSLSVQVWFHTQFRLASHDGQGLPDKRDIHYITILTFTQLKIIKCIYKVRISKIPQLCILLQMKNSWVL